jgi:hypothetical protein
MKKPGPGEKNMAFTITVAVLVLGIAVTMVCLDRFEVLPPKPTEKSITRKLDLGDPSWVDRLVELSVPSYKKDFTVYGIFRYLGEETTVSLVYATQAALGDIRAFYLEALDDSLEEGQNHAGSIGVRGRAKGRSVQVYNYFSEVSNLIRVDMEMTGVYASRIRERIITSFPQQAIDSQPAIASLAKGPSVDGYVLYDGNTFSLDSYANAPIFSRAYRYGGTEEESREAINALAVVYTDPMTSRIGKGVAEIKQGDYLYQIKPALAGGETIIAIMVQRIPGNGENS